MLQAEERLNAGARKNAEAASIGLVDPRHLRTNLALQQLRGIAMLLVLWQHLSISATIISATGTGLTNPGYMGVNLFFVLSGYVVVLTLHARDWSLPYFLSRRVFRLYPALLVFLALSAVVILLASRSPPGTFPRDFFGASLAEFAAQSWAVLTGTFLGVARPLYVNGAMWSLSVEFQFYFFFALFLAAMTLARMTSRRIGQALLAMAIAGLVVALGARLYTLTGQRLPGLLTHLLGYKFDFLLPGIILALAGKRVGSALARLPPSTLRWGLFGSLLLTLAILAVSRSPLEAPASINLLDGLAMPMVLLLLSVTVVCAAQMPEGFGQRWPWLRGMLLWVGDRSYTIYLLHYPVLALTWFAFANYAPPQIFQAWNYSLAQMILGGGAALILSDLTFRFVEKPAIAFGARRFGVRVAPAKTATA